MEKTISASKLAELSLQQDVDLLDVRTPLEFREVHAKIARNLPLDRLDPNSVMADRNGTGDDALYVICKMGGRGATACRKFYEAGFENVINVEGGTAAWSAAGLPVVRGKQAVSLERQVRIVAGTIVLLASLLAVTVHPYFAGIAAFMGAGLAFAGLTDTCGMGMLLARMPWNQLKPAPEAGCFTDRSVG
jgi:rhodanese-related sulfurtransferase